MITQSASLLITLSVAVLVATGRIVYWHLIVSSALMGFVNTFDTPTRQSFVIELVGKDDLAGGIALNSAQFNLARILGPALAGIIMASWDISICFFINSISFGAVLVSLFFVHPMAIEKKEVRIDNIFRNIGEGLRFVFGKPSLLLPVLFLIIAATFAMNQNVLIPVFAKEVLHQEETGYGFLMSMSGIGALAGALTMATISRGGIKNTFVFVFPLIVGLFVAAVGFTSVYAIAAISLAVMSFLFMIFLASVNTTLQLGATNEYRGRVMSIYSLIMSGTTPLGNLFAGGAAENFGPRAAFIACGAVIVLALVPLYFVQRKKGVTVTAQIQR
jgi:predicted MFS family arabinose efflux permease